MNQEDVRRQSEPSLSGTGPEESTDSQGSTDQGVSRRNFLQALGLGATAATLPRDGLLGQATTAAEGDGDTTGPGPVPVKLKVNGKALSFNVEPRVTLLDALRDHINVDTSKHADLTGSKRVCDRGSCGACTVMIDGRTTYACSVLAIAAQGKEILTVEGLAPDGELSPVQQKFVDCDGLMCGFCTPGFIVSATALLENNASPTRDEIKRALDGNICRCGTQSRALEAVEVVARKKGGK